MTFGKRKLKKFSILFFSLHLKYNFPTKLKQPIFEVGHLIFSTLTRWTIPEKFRMIGPPQAAQKIGKVSQT